MKETLLERLQREARDGLDHVIQQHDQIDINSTPIHLHKNLRLYVENLIANILKEAREEIIKTAEGMKTNPPGDYINTSWTPDELRHGESYDGALTDLIEVIKK